MTRTIALLLLLGDPYPWKAGNAFAEQYRTWADLRNVRVQSAATVDTVNARERVEWLKLERAWLEFQKQQRSEYRGER